MTRRVIDSELYFDTELFDILGSEGLHLYIRLWGLADDSGVYEPRYGDIALKMGVIRFTSDGVRDVISALIKTGKIVPYVVNGKQYHWLKNFHRHQPMKNARPPIHPLPAWIECKTSTYPSGKQFSRYTVKEELIPQKPDQNSSDTPRTLLGHSEELLGGHRDRDRDRDRDYTPLQSPHKNETIGEKSTSCPEETPPPDVVSEDDGTEPKEGEPEPKTKKKQAFHDLSIQVKLAERMFGKIREIYPKARAPNMQSWAMDFDLMIRIDGRKAEEIDGMLDRVFQDDFWCKNILSPGSLRKQWDRMYIKFYSGNGNNNGRPKKGLAMLKEILAEEERARQEEGHDRQGG